MKGMVYYRIYLLEPYIHASIILEILRRLCLLEAVDPELRFNIQILKKEIWQTMAEKTTAEKEIEWT